jgi:hypothetical protein
MVTGVPKRGEPGKVSYQLILDDGAAEYVLRITADDAKVLRDWFHDAERVYFEMEREVLIFGEVLRSRSVNSRSVNNLLNGVDRFQRNMRKNMEHGIIVVLSNCGVNGGLVPTILLLIPCHLVHQVVAIGLCGLTNSLKRKR